MPSEIQAFSLLTCPLDGEPLLNDNNMWKCHHGHSFDVAKQGYIHLLPVQNKRSRDPGDSKEMIAARQRFLNANHYLPIAQAVSQAVLNSTDTTQDIACLDAGCGEGYYLRQMASAILNKDTLIATETNQHQLSRKLQLVGLDISKWAILAAAKQDARTRWIVGTNAKLPIPSNSLDIVLCLFGFPVYSEFSRVLKQHGKIIQVDAGPRHLIELREIIYPSLKPASITANTNPDGFQLQTQHTIQHQIQLTTPNNIADLLVMTPHLYRASSEGLERANQLQSLTLTVDAQLKIYDKS
ncbi:23S rRNA (guanine(745)-N(1))-methyltransferase [Thalassocella blandensis]|nr:23S rRNA (guanine(745)-N(1))-methyltransferase [Thalassocella blandensis]